MYKIRNIYIQYCLFRITQPKGKIRSQGADTRFSTGGGSRFQPIPSDRNIGGQGRGGPKISTGVLSIPWDPICLPLKYLLQLENILNQVSLGLICLYVKVFKSYNIFVQNLPYDMDTRKQRHFYTSPI